MKKNMSASRSRGLSESNRRTLLVQVENTKKSKEDLEHITMAHNFK
jgi:hypothetical protein